MEKWRNLRPSCTLLPHSLFKQYFSSSQFENPKLAKSNHRTMKFLTIAVLSLLHPAVGAEANESSADNTGNPPRYIGQRSKHRRERRSAGDPVRYFTIPATQKGKHLHRRHDPRDRHLQSRIVGGSESEPNEFPYYGENNKCIPNEHLPVASNSFYDS